MDYKRVGPTQRESAESMGFELFDKNQAESLTGHSLQQARQQLVSSLRDVTKIPLIEQPRDNNIHCVEVISESGGDSPSKLTWRGFIGTSDGRDDDVFVYGAHLFPFIDNHRVSITRMDKSWGQKPYSFWYLLLTPENGWEDLGWQVDECGEFEHWYLEPKE